MSSVSSDTERKEQSGLSGLFQKSHINEGTSVHEMRKTGKDGRRILPGLQKRGSSFYRRKKYFSYGEIWRQSLVRFKYYGCREYGDFYAKAISIYGRKYLERWKPQLIVPVPLHSRKKRMRGFNQAAYLAERVSRFTGIPWSDNLVIKIRNTKSQKKLNASQRKKNLRNAYLVTRKITGFSVLVVDDVYTTGSTMDAMAMCLQEAGAKDVYFLTVCAGRA